MSAVLHTVCPGCKATLGVPADPLAQAPPATTTPAGEAAGGGPAVADSHPLVPADSPAAPAGPAAEAPAEADAVPVSAAVDAPPAADKGGYATAVLPLVQK